MKKQRFIDNENGTVTDNVTSLIWQGDLKGNLIQLNWHDAIKYAKKLKLAKLKWRLPTIEELASLIDYKCSSHATKFLNMEPSNYWSSSTDVGNSTDAWYVNFDFGFVVSNLKTSNYYVRCVSGSMESKSHEKITI